MISLVTTNSLGRTMERAPTPLAHMWCHETLHPAPRIDTRFGSLGLQNGPWMQCSDLEEKYCLFTLRSRLLDVFFTIWERKNSKFQKCKFWPGVVRIFVDYLWNLKPESTSKFPIDPQNRNWWSFRLRTGQLKFVKSGDRSIEIAKSWTDQNFSDSRTGQLKILTSQTKISATDWNSTSSRQVNWNSRSLGQEFRNFNGLP